MGCKVRQTPHRGQRLNAYRRRLDSEFGGHGKPLKISEKKRDTEELSFWGKKSGCGYRMHNRGEMGERRPVRKGHGHPRVVAQAHSTAALKGRRRESPPRQGGGLHRTSGTSCQDMGQQVTR